MHTDASTFARFDKFNLKYNPCGDSLLRTIFLKTDNYVSGRYLAELTKELLADLEETKYQLSEYRLSIYGRKPTEWRQLAQWVMGHGLISSYNKWMIQVRFCSRLSLLSPLLFRLFHTHPPQLSPAVLASFSVHTHTHTALLIDPADLQRLREPRYAAGAIIDCDFLLF